MPRTAAGTPRTSRRSPRDVSASPSGTHSPSKRLRAKSPAGNQAKSPTKRTRTTSSSPSLSIIADGFSIAGSSSPAADDDHLPGGDPRSSGNVDAPPSGADEALSSDGSFALVEAVRDDSVRQLLRQLLIDKQSLQGELADLKSKADKREQVRAYEEGAPTGFSHDRQALRSSFMHFIFKHMTDPVARDYWSSLVTGTLPLVRRLLGRSLCLSRCSSQFALRHSSTSSGMPTVLWCLGPCLPTTCSCTSQSRRTRTRLWWSGTLGFLLCFR